MSSKPILILLHGALGSASQLHPLKQILEGEFSIHLMNFSGHGGLQIPVAGFSLELFEKDIMAYLQMNVIDAAHFFGYSMGGYAALSLAEKHPGLVKSVFTLATKFDWSPESAMREVKFLDPVKTLERVPDFAKQLEDRHAPSDWKMVMKHTADFLIQLGNKHLEAENFANIKCPVRLSVGDRDKMVTIAETHKVFQSLTKGSMLVIPETPHPIESCDMGRIAWEINQFCNSMK